MAKQSKDTKGGTNEAKAVDKPLFVVPDSPEAIVERLTHVSYDDDERSGKKGEYIQLRINFAGVALAPILKDAAKNATVTFARVNRDKPETREAFHRFWSKWGAVNEDGEPLNQGKRKQMNVKRLDKHGGKYVEVSESVPVVDVHFNNVGQAMEYPLSPEEKADKLLQETNTETAEDVAALIALLEAKQKAMKEAANNNEGNTEEK